MKSGEADGVPPLPTREARERWIEVFDAEFDRFCAELHAGKEGILDPYAAEHEAEFFAVASEAFFESPNALKREYPKLYGLFQGFYKQDPSQRLKA
jgi:Mlc titration factor MtfA (ptsG expression regulator)